MMIIDRFEGECAVVELNKDNFVNIPRVILPKAAKEGDVITVEIDRERTAERRKHLESLAQDLWTE